MSRAAIIGGGVIGGGWAARFLLNGWDVAVFDPDPEAARKINDVLLGARRALPMLYDRALPAEGRLTFCDTLEEAVAGAAWVQESVPERLALKHSVLKSLQDVVSEEAVIGSSTSGFTPSQLQEGSARPGQIIVTHPFNPVYLIPLVEVVGSAENDAEMLEKADSILTSLGMFPLRVRAEIDAHIADRLLEAVWREALWLVSDGIATTEEIDNAIRYGFGLRWAQMGLFETYRIAGGEAGMKHFMEQFGPALAWPWTKLMDVPEFTPELVDLIATQSDAQSGALDIRALERLRDDNLVAMMRALKQRDAAAGALLNAHEATLPKPPEQVPLRSVERVIPVDWTDYNGHMNEGRYGQIFSDAADAVMAEIGADATYIAGGLSYFTVETTVKYLKETHAGERVHVASRITLADGKKLRLWHEMIRSADDTVLASCDQFLLHVSLETRASCPPAPTVLAKLGALARQHGATE
ncbi:carnitine 3-dehydrogenase [Cognatishimia sp. MH4019]|uniref:carnitine 3-dehydrogenase n=1 Tax=Cognatishimia sp. MH4019 TaxID=2854030 RepID=UPI001CD3C3AA|nr:carnitine 3-dehydrogenase [Cognatishimia sp. MH4019]